jgi:hypothetical protein
VPRGGEHPLYLVVAHRSGRRRGQLAGRCRGPERLADRGPVERGPGADPCNARIGQVGQPDTRLPEHVQREARLGCHGGGICLAGQPRDEHAIRSGIAVSSNPAQRLGEPLRRRRRLQPVRVGPGVHEHARCGRHDGCDHRGVQAGRAEPAAGQAVLQVEAGHPGAGQRGRQRRDFRRVVGESALGVHRDRHPQPPGQRAAEFRGDVTAGPGAIEQAGHGRDPQAGGPHGGKAGLLQQERGCHVPCVRQHEGQPWAVMQGGEGLARCHGRSISRHDRSIGIETGMRRLGRGS